MVLCANHIRFETINSSSGKGCIMLHVIAEGFTNVVPKLTRDVPICQPPIKTWEGYSFPRSVIIKQTSSSCRKQLSLTSQSERLEFKDEVEFVRSHRIFSTSRCQ